MNSIILLIIKRFALSVFAVFFVACAPVKYSKSDFQVVGDSCSGDSCVGALPAIVCDPKINGNLTGFSYPMTPANLPSINANCVPGDVTVTWSLRKADAGRVQQAVAGLSGLNPTGINLTLLGTGSYYLFLNAKKTGMRDFVSSIPLEFVVGGSAIGSGLTCDPKLNGNATSLTLSNSGQLPKLSANCVPGAGNYIWNATKDGKAVSLPGLSGAEAQPDFMSLGAGTYQISLYATATGSTHWRSAAPLTLTVPTGVSANERSLNCNPQINGTMTGVTLKSSSPKPLVSANCNSTKLKYFWTATKNGLPVNIAQLAGANSNPNFQKSGRGTYTVLLKAEDENKAQWNSTTPLLVTVEDVDSAQTVNCSPRVNGEFVSASLSPEMKNPTLTSSCSPSFAKVEWQVFKDGKQIELADLKKESSVPQFIGAGPGNYDVFLTATADGYNAYRIPFPLQVKVSEKTQSARQITQEKLIDDSIRKLDILLVIDDSTSMLPENSKLGQRLEGMVRSLTASGVNWQMCATVTRWQDDNPEKIQFWGGSRKWVNYIGTPQWLLTAGAINLAPIFADTMKAIGSGWANSDDERGVKAAIYHAEYAEFNNCYRKDAALAVILISDEDERSIGGNPGDIYYDNELKYLESDDYPAAYIAKIREKFGNNKPVTFNSIIVKPGDSDCMQMQDVGGAKSHFGYHYAELSEMTGGGIGSICENDYSPALALFKDRILTSMDSITLDCAPVGAIKSSVTPSMGGYSAKLENNRVVFNPGVPAGRTIRLEYQCSSN